MVHECQPISLIQWITSGRDFSDYQLEVLSCTGMYIARNRTMAARYLLYRPSLKEFDYLFFWDYDNGLPPETFDLFMEDFEDPEVNIVAGNYFRKEETMRSVHGFMPENADAFVSEPAMFLNAGLISLTDFPGARAGMLGCGCMMIRRSVFEELPYPWFQDGEVPCRSVAGWTFQGEDVFFCMLAQAHGYKVHLDTRIASAHWGGDKCYPETWRHYGWHEDEDHSDVANRKERKAVVDLPDYGRGKAEVDNNKPKVIGIQPKMLRK
jgi:hypothetical protein